MISDTSEHSNKVFSYLLLFNAVILLNIDKQIIGWEKNASDLFGYQTNEMVGQQLVAIFPNEQQLLIGHTILDQIVLNGFWNGQVEFAHKNQSPGWVEVVVTVNENNKNETVWACRDISETIKNRQLLMERVFRDQLTQLGNRRFIYEHLGQVLEKRRENGEKVGVLFLDLDGFKDINDRYGHESGDLVLKEVAVRLQQVLRSGDVVARLAGDEFVIILDQLHERDNIKIVYKRVIEILKKPICLETEEIVVSTSMGYAIFPDDGKTPRDLIKCADADMYHYKRKLKENAVKRIFLEKEE